MQTAKYVPYTRADVVKSSSRKLFTVMSLFAGGGGSSTGYRLAGGNVVAINEFVEEAIKTYSMNFPDTKIVPGDIRAITGEDLLKIAGLKPGELDIMDGSPPCSAFSIANRNRGSEENNYGKEKIYSDGMVVKNIEDLFLEYIRVATAIKPKVIVAENVPGLLVNTLHVRKKLMEFIAGFESISPGYKMTYSVLDASKYGVAQARKRVFFVGVRSDVAEELGLDEFQLSRIYPPRTTPAGVSLRSAIEDVQNDPEEVQMLLDYVQNSFQKKYIETMPLNPQKILKPKALTGEHVPMGQTLKATCYNMRRPAAHLPCPTLTQRGQQRSVSGILHYGEHRKFTIPELKRIMSLPDDFQLTGNFDQQAERIGRMVAPKVMAALATSIYTKIIKPYNDRKSSH